MSGPAKGPQGKAQGPVAISDRLRAVFGVSPPPLLGVAVSGGGDSVALLVLLSDWARNGGPALAAVTVDHGLRPEAADEAAAVSGLCARLGIAHHVLHWAWDGQGNLAAAARHGRYRLIADWARVSGVAAVALGHTRDDQAETLLMRLARGSGVDGLACMAAQRSAQGIDWWRPLLSVGRDELRALLAARGVAWSEDPSNDDPAYDRVKARRALAALGSIGLNATRLVQTSEWMQLARDVLDRTALDLGRSACRIANAEVEITRAPFAAAPRETQLRLLSGVLRWMGQGDYRPRLAPLSETCAAVMAGGRRTLAGCVLDGRARDVIRVSREPAALGGPVAPGEIWDGRWRVIGPAEPGLTVAALGAAGLARCVDWRQSGLPRRVLVVSPAVWRGGTLVAAPLLRAGGIWHAEPACGEESLWKSLIAH